MISLAEIFAPLVFVLRSILGMFFGEIDLCCVGWLLLRDNQLSCLLADRSLGGLAELGYVFLVEFY